MKKQITTLLSVCLMTTIASAGGIGVYGALWDTDDFGDTAGLGAKLIIGGAPLGLEIRGTYFDDLTESSGPFDYDLQAIPVEVGPVYNAGISENVSLQLGAGLGYFFLDSSSGDVDDEIGFYGSGGLSFQLTDSMSLFGEAIYRWVNGTVEGDDFGDFESGTDFDLDGLGVNVGLIFN